MLNDFEMIKHHFPKNDDITIIPIGDVHLGARECYHKQWENFCENLMKQKNTYILLAGDLINNATRNSVSNVYEEIWRPREQKQRMVEALDPIKDRILGAVSGNHERRNRDVDDDPMYDIMCKLDKEHLFRENIAFIKIQIGKREGAGERNPTYMFAMAHGHGSSIYTGAAGTKAERFGMSIDGIDCLVVGHVHKPMNYPVGKIMVDKHNENVKTVDWRLVVATSWLGYAGYAAQKLLTPTVHCEQEIILAGNKKRLRVTQ